MTPTTPREVQIARAAYIQGRRDERAEWRERMTPRSKETEVAATLYPDVPEVTA